MQTLPAVILATSWITWVERWPVFAVSLVLLLIPAGDAEVWLNSITSQFHLALCVAIILAADVRGGLVGALQVAVLLLAPLAGPVAGCLTPLFLLRAIFERSSGRFLQAALLAAPTLIQAVIVLTHPEFARAFGIGLKLLLAVIGMQNVILPIVGDVRAKNLSEMAIDLFRKGGIPVLTIASGIFGVGALGGAVWRRGDRAAVWLFAAGATLAVVSYSAALTLGEPLNLLFWLGCRYAFVPTVLFSLGLLGLAVTRPLRGGVIPAVLIVWMIYLGIGRYLSNPSFFLKDRSGRPRSRRGASTRHISFGCGRGRLVCNSAWTHPRGRVNDVTFRYGRPEEAKIRKHK